MRARPAILLLGLMLTAPGCVVMKVTVENPILGMNTIAVAPFVNLTQEPPEVVDGRRFAIAYFAELQKTKGFQVIPVGVTEVAILKHQLNMTKKDDVLRLARILKADAVVVGAITDYYPYYPQRIGLQVDWYAPDDWSQPTEPIRPGLGGPLGPGMGMGPGGADCPPGSLGEGKADCQPPTELPPQEELPVIRGQTGSEQEESEPVPSPPGPELPPIAPGPLGGHSGAFERLPAPLGPGGVPPPVDTGIGPDGLPTFDPRIPIMSYTRLFDGADSDVVNKLRDYLELRGDRRSGGWEGHLHRSEDFIRFASHLMIVEMLSLHGGVSKSQIVFKWRKYQ